MILEIIEINKEKTREPFSRRPIALSPSLSFDAGRVGTLYHDALGRGNVAISHYALSRGDWVSIT